MVIKMTFFLKAMDTSVISRKLTSLFKDFRFFSKFKAFALVCKKKNLPCLFMVQNFGFIYPLILAMLTIRYFDNSHSNRGESSQVFKKPSAKLS